MYKLAIPFFINLFLGVFESTVDVLICCQLYASKLQLFVTWAGFFFYYYFFMLVGTLELHYFLFFVFMY